MQAHQDSLTNKASNRKKPVQRSQEEWQALISQSYESDLSAKEFCRHHQVALSNFYHWRNKLKNNETPSSCIDMSAISSPLDRVEVQTPAVDSSWQVELELGAGMVLRIRAV